MPHCPRALYHNLLLENWTVENLRKIIIIGNSFSAYDTKQISNKKNSFMKRISPHMTEFPIKISDNRSDSDLFMAFHDTSVHILRENSVENETNDFWQKTEEECVDELL